MECKTASNDRNEKMLRRLQLAELRHSRTAGIDPLYYSLYLRPRGRNRKLVRVRWQAQNHA